MFSCPIRVHSWFKHCLDYVFAYSCPFVSIRGSPSSPSFVFFRVFRVFRGSNTAWTTFVSIRVHSCPFVVLPLPPPRVFRGSNTAWTTLFCIFVSIRVLSWFSLFPPFVYIRVHSCPFVVQTSIWTTFVSIRVHSWFSLFPLLRVFSWFDSPFSLLPTCPILSLFKETGILFCT